MVIGRLMSNNKPIRLRGGDTYPLIVQGLFSGIRRKVFTSENRYEFSIFFAF